jgi:hypothetical protein
MRIDLNKNFWKVITEICLIFGAIIMVLTYFLFNFKIIGDSGMQWLSSMSLGLTSIGLGSFAIYKTLYSEKRIEELQRNEILIKISNFRITNDYNKKLIQNLINHKDNWFPQRLLDKKLKQSVKQKYILTSGEIKQIKGLWIPKEDFFFEYAINLLDISHHLDVGFINKIMIYVKEGKKLNLHKETCQQWALTRGLPNPDETRNYYNSLDVCKKIVDEMSDLISQQEKKYEKG